MKPKTNPSVKKLVEDNRLPEPENSPASYMDDLVTHHDFVQFIESLGFKYGWTAFSITDDGTIYKDAYDWHKNTKSTTDNIQRAFKIDIHTSNGEGSSHKLVSINATCLVSRYSRIERSVKFKVTYNALIRPAIPNSPYVECTAKDFVSNVVTLIKKITPKQSDEESSKLLKTIEHQFKEIDQSKNHGG